MDRQTFVDAALSVVGYGSNPSNSNRADYVDLVAPGEAPNKVNDMLLMSGCGLVVAGIWRKAGVVHRKLNPPYIIGTAVSRLTTLAHSVGAWVDFAPDQYPSPGDMVLVGDNGAGGVEHVFTVVEIDGAGSLVSVDGGQRDDAHYQIILKKNRIWKGQKDISYIGSDPGSQAIGGRKIYGWVNCELLPDGTTP